MRLRFLVEGAASSTLFGAARLMPRRLLHAIGSLAGSVGYWVDVRHRRVALRNLRAAFGSSLAKREARLLARNCWRHFGTVILDAAAFPRYSAASVGSMVHYEGLEHIRAAYESGRGVLLFSGHYGHWELVAAMQGFLGMPVALVTRPLDNPLLERMLTRLRARSGNTIIHKQGAVREMIRQLRRGGGVAIVIDQDARDEGVFVPFFGRPASTTPTLAWLALRTGAAVIPVFSVPRPDGSYRVVYEPEVRFTPTDDRRSDVVRLTAICTSIIERWVREHPEIWLWMHRRWKTRPEG